MINPKAASLRQIDDYANGNSFFHTVHPLANFINCIVFIIMTVSLPKYSVTPLVIMGLYPFYVMYVAGISVKVIFMCILPVVPLIFFMAVFNPMLDKNYFIIMGHTMSAGYISALSLVLRGVLCAVTALTTVSVAGIDGISLSMRMMKVPKMFVTQFVLTFRYIHTLLEEAGTISLSYSLRSKRRDAPTIREWGVLSGSYFLRTLKRANAIYDAMRLRGFDGVMPYNVRAFAASDAIVVLVFSGFFTVMRFVDIPYMVGEIVFKFWRLI